MIYEQNYRKLQELGILNAVNGSQQAKTIKAGGYMDLHIDYLGRRKISGRDARVIAIAHNYEQNGDIIADPDMELAIYDDVKMVEALTYQDCYRFQAVYPSENMVDCDAKNSLNRFLGQWLRNLKMQGFKGC